jgi:ubiquitin-conjugating enzyme (huntingtin interacting protein 2)
MTAFKRVSKELKELNKFINSDTLDSHRILSIEINDDNILSLNVYFLGPRDSPYEETLNNILIEIPNEYPSVAPKMRFVNKLYHPNVVLDTGAICLDILKDKWTPVYTIRTIILSIISLLSEPNPDSPLNGQAAKLYKESLFSKKSYQEYVRIVMSYDK